MNPFQEDIYGFCGQHTLSVEGRRGLGGGRKVMLFNLLLFSDPPPLHFQWLQGKLNPKQKKKSILNNIKFKLGFDMI